MAKMKTDPTKPPITTLIKLGSLLVHYQELLGGTGHEFDRVTIKSLEADPEIIEWKKQMDDLALLPVKR